MLYVQKDGTVDISTIQNVASLWKHKTCGGGGQHIKFMLSKWFKHIFINTSMHLYSVSD